MSQIIVNNQALQQKLEAAAAHIKDTLPLMRSISLVLLDETEQNFAAQGRPKWAGLSPVYAAKRKGGKILQLSGQMAASATPFFNKTESGIGSNKVYARIQHFGGMAGRGLKSKIPSRTWLPMDKLGNLQPQAEAGIFEVADIFLKKTL